MCCFRNGTSQGTKKIPSHAHKAESRYLLGVFLKISDEHPPALFICESPLGLQQHGQVFNTVIIVALPIPR